MDVKIILNKLKIEGKIDSYANLYKELDLNVGSANSAIRRCSISNILLQKIIDFCNKKNIDLNYIFLNKEPKESNVINKLTHIEHEIYELKRELRA